jgi:hypothetical protein
MMPTLQELNTRCASDLYLPLTNGEIKLVKILPLKHAGGECSGHSHCPIECTITTARLGRCHYNALSYVWGDQLEENLKVIYLNGQGIYVTSNLVAALEQFRKDGLANIDFWIDTLCI